MMRRDSVEVEVRRRLAASPERVFAAFADPALVARWLTPGPEVTLRVLHFDFRVGGTYRFAYEVPGSGAMFVNGSYRSIERPGLIVFSWNIEPPDEHAGIRSEVTVTLKPRGSGTDLLIRHKQLDAPGAPPRHEAGWQGALERLVELLNRPEQNPKPGETR